ncbi:MAG: alpha/beta fold hydrolase [Spirochaetaceae bacterium]
MKLHYLKYDSESSGTPIVILHGLFGAGDNWSSQARELTALGPVLAPDLPNFGASPHTGRFDYRELAGDVASFLEELGLERCVLLGHSMGGKIAMSLALQWPELVAALIVADISPKPYKPRHQEELRAMEEVRRAGARNRREADRVMAARVENRAIRAFLLKNYREGDDGRHQWRFNLDGVREHHREISDWPEHDGVYDGPALLIRGGRSPYVVPEDLELARRLFPRVELRTIEDAGHWLHAERREEFLDEVRRFLEVSV